MKIFHILFGLIVLPLFCGCSSYLTGYENVSNIKNTYEKILVIGRSKSKTARIKFENGVVDELKESGISAVASHAAKTIIDFNKKYSESELGALKKKLMTNGIDGVIVTNLINTEEYTDVIPGGTSTTYVPTRIGRFGRYLTYYPVTTWEPNELKSGTKYIFESSLYHLVESSGEDLQWVGNFEIKDPTSLENTVNNYAKNLTKALIKGSISN
ncbi:MAG: hypothetical protein AAGC45_00515 [Bacteroidota bacterium]